MCHSHIMRGGGQSAYTSMMHVARGTDVSIGAMHTAMNVAQRLEGRLNKLLLALLDTANDILMRTSPYSTEAIE